MLTTSVVSANGTLDEHKIVKKENLYQGMNGRFVERFFVTPLQSYIFKPLTNDSQIGKEVWIYENILTKFPPIYPKMIEHSSSTGTDNHWIIYEDLGAIRHIFSEELLVELTKQIAWWNSFPTDNLLNAPLKGPKPFIEEIVANILFQKEKVIELVPKYTISSKWLENIINLLGKNSFSKTKVFTHGDLHLGNFGYANNTIVVLDWEHAHLNSLFWDLYHVLDISHPIFPKRINKELRNNVLDVYLNERGIPANSEIRKMFKQEYYLFSAAFSIWMLLLIQTDLVQNKTNWSNKQLHNQLEETVNILVQCGEELEKDSKSGSIKN